MVSLPTLIGTAISKVPGYVSILTAKHSTFQWVNVKKVAVYWWMEAQNSLWHSYEKAYVVEVNQLRMMMMIGLLSSTKEPVLQCLAVNLIIYTRSVGC